VRGGVAGFLVLAALFLAVNRQAYQGYFQDDEIDILSWTPYASFSAYLEGAVSPRFQEQNFRPVGHGYFHAAEALFHLDFPKYVVVLHAVHLLNVWLIWLLARQLGATPVASAAACVLFTFHMALFDAVWKPMYAFDVLCATFSLASIVLYARRRWVLSFLAFWLAYKAKELAVMLPFVLIVYEFWFAKRRWQPLVPFCAASLSFGVQALLLNPNQDNEYTFRFTAAALSKTLPYYARRVFLLHYAGFLLPLSAFVARNRRTWFGLVLMSAFLFPLLWLPGRMFSAYCYLPFTGLAIAFAGIAEVRRGWIAAALLLASIPLHVHEFRVNRRATLARDQGIRTWITTLNAFAATNPRVDTFVYDGAPDGFAPWGIEGAVKYCFHRYNAVVHSANDPESASLLRQPRTAILTWDRQALRLNISTSP
jgi:hypothetical protein